MTRREMLMEQYEDALFALIMDEVAEVEGQKALEENQRLKESGELVIPEEVSQRCQRVIARKTAEMMDELNESFYMNAESINMTPYADTVISFFGDNDPNIPQEILYDFATAIGGRVNCVPNAGHFNASAGYLTCPAVLDAVNRC